MDKILDQGRRVDILEEETNMGSFTTRARKFKKDLSGRGLNNLIWLKNRIYKQIWPSLKGSRRDPLLYLGAVCASLFLIVSLVTPSFTGADSWLIFNQGSQCESPFVMPGTTIKESPDLSLVQQNSLAAVSTPIMATPQVLGSLIEGSQYDATRREIIEYTVQEGDNLWSISQMFNVSIDTVIWANSIGSAIIQPGQKLLILPVSGVMHLVEAGDTVSALAAEYKADAEEIFSFNNIRGEGDIFKGEVLIIPGGKMPSYSSVNVPSSGSISSLSTNNFFGRSHDYPYGQCTWWVAQNRAIPSWGNAIDWLYNAAASGYATCVGSYCTPQVGAVISLEGHRIYGHVGYVERVEGDKVIFSEANYIGWGKMNYRTLRIGDLLIKGYIY